MKRVLFILVGFLALTSFSLESSNWLTDFDTAVGKCKSSGKKILIDFSGSDWCRNCMRLENDLFAQDTFKKFAADNLVLLKVDFPSKKKNKLSSDQKKHNETLAEKYNPKGIFPLVIVVDSSGTLLGTMKHPCKEAKEYIKSIDNILNPQP
jgi:thioredoxin-related protein